MLVCETSRCPKVGPMPIPPLFDLSGKVAIVTGATGGVGRSIAQQLANHGARVVVSSATADACDGVVADVKANWAQGPGDAMAIACNAGDRGQCYSLVDRTIAAWGRVDILVCNAEASRDVGPVNQTSEAEFAEAIDTNIRGVLWLAERACADMAARRDGAVIIIGSADGLRGTPETGLYGITKAAEVQIARNLAVDWGAKNIRANCIAPATIAVDAQATTDDKLKDGTPVEWVHPMARIGTAEDVSGVVVALAGPAGAWLSGQTITIDGGMMAGSGREGG
jgi:NAD(P)-dependent dehydrogenase (short-subunit alcohol dehydrogenase family)